MNAQPDVSGTDVIDKLAKVSSELGYEIVDIAGFLDLLEEQAREQRGALQALGTSAKDMVKANDDASAILQKLAETSGKTQEDVRASVSMVRDVGEKTNEVAVWVKSVRDRTSSVGETLKAVTANNSQIAAIAAQVNTLAINAKIEAARAGDAGRGFAVVADAINDLSQKTSTAAKQISENIDSLTGWISDLSREASHVAEDADDVLSKSSQSDAALSRMETTIRAEHEQSGRVTDQTAKVRDAVQRLRPAVRDIDMSVTETTAGIEKAHKRVETLVERSERIVQLTAHLGGTSADAPFIAFVQQTAKRISEALDAAVSEGRIDAGAVFDQSYTAVPGSDPKQVTTRATTFFDNLLPRFQEPALDFDPRVVFCAAVDTNGYLPTHNQKFSQPQTDDVAWNTANCRNRRIFNDRVGLKAGRNTAPFLLQVYRRDMGGGNFQVMKDLSAPIKVGGRHWGGLRLAYS